jgi:hypothetical protein
MSEAWYISRTEEWFSEGPLDSREEAIREGVAQFDGEPFWIGKREDYAPFQRDWLDEALELETNDVYDECGSDASDQWPSRVSHDGEYHQANEEIRAILLRIYGKPSVFKVEDAEQIVPEDNAALAQARGEEL